MKDIKFLSKKFIAHRGYHNKKHPENSLGAFANAIANNFMIELDLQLTKDLEVVVFHDDKMERTTGICGTIHDYTLKEIQDLKILGSEEKIPIFKEVLDFVNGQVELIIEFKSQGKNNSILVEKAIELLKDYKGKFIVQSFDPILLNKIRISKPEFIIGQLVAPFDDNSISKFKGFILKNMLTNFLSKPDFINTHYKYYTRKMKRLNKKGKPILCWTIRSKEEQLLASKFDNITFENFDPRI